MIRKPLFLVFVLSSFIIVAFFQNCGEQPVELKQLGSVSGAYSLLDIQGKFCLENNFKLVSFFIVNMSMKPDFSSLQPDSDRDGLSDSFEIAKGFDPYNPRSSGQVLDGVCFYLTQSNKCQDLGITCSGKENEMGLSDCDVKAMNLQINDSPQLGLDSDEDGIPDMVEILYDTDPAVDDALLDYDSDNLTNFAEALQGSHPRQERSTVSQFSDEFVTQKVAATDTSCGGEEWIFKAINQKVFKLSDQGGSNLTNNHIWLIALSEKAETTLSVQRNMQYIKLERGFTLDHPELNFISDDFLLGDNLFFRRGDGQ